MLPRQLHAALDGDLPHLNPVLANGLAIEHMRGAESFIEQVMRSVGTGFPPGFRFVGPSRVTPIEEYEETVKNKNNRRLFDVARSDVYMMRYTFQFNDEPLKHKYMYLPFVGQAGMIHLSGSRFVISPILADRVISVGLTTVFIRLLKAKLTFNRISHYYVADNHTENIQVVWCRIHNQKQKFARPTVRAEHASVHYLLCKYGFTGMFEKFVGIAPIVGNETSINEDRYPPSEWVICHSTGIKPKGVRPTYPASYKRSPIRIAIKRTDYTANVRNLLAGFFYVVDHFSERVLPEYVDNTDEWRVLLGHVIWPGAFSKGRLLSDVNDHLASLDEYVDNLSRAKLHQINHRIDTIYELFFLIISNFNDWMLSSEDRVSTMYDKELSILQFVFMGIIEQINQLGFKLNAGKKNQLTAPKIDDLLNSCLRLGLIYGLTKNSGVCTTASTSGDNMALKITNNLVPQSASNRQPAAKARTVIADPTKRLHGSVAEVGSYIGLPKSSPDGRARLNLCLKINESGLVQRDQQFVPLIDGVQEKIRR